MLLVILVACSPVPNNAGFQITIFDDSWLDLHLSYTPGEAFPILLNLDRTQDLFTIGLQQIENCDWDTQTLTLTRDATGDLLKALESATYGQESLVTDMLDELGWGNHLEKALYLKAFVVSIEGTPIYGGVFLQEYSQMGITFPVFRVTEIDGQAILRLAPVQPPFSWDEIKGQDLAEEDPARPMVDLILDERIRSVLEEAQKLNQ